MAHEKNATIDNAIETITPTLLEIMSDCYAEGYKAALRDVTKRNAKDFGAECYGKRDHRLQVVLSKETKAKVSALAYERRVTVNELVNTALIAYVEAFKGTTI